MSIFEKFKLGLQKTASSFSSGLKEIIIKREIDDTNLLMATGEALAHLNCLIERGLAKKYFKKNVAYYEQV